ncbi:MAG TPA: DUF72 domain-containing protein [Ideonella sp.]|nr:DUF72 domain-containing protein [Ideonella sp.]
MTEANQAARVRVGIGGWTFAPWRDNFYPAGLAHSKELGYASRQLTAIEINGTFYSAQKPATFAKWRDETPDGFVFSVKASQYATHRRVLAEAGESVERFVNGGVAQLGPKLGPIVWQFMRTKQFDAQDFGAFLALLPASVEGLRLRHVVDVRHESFKSPEFIALIRRHGVAAVLTDALDLPSFANPTADFVYARLMCSRAEIAQGYPAGELDAVAACARCWAVGGEPADLPMVAEPAEASVPAAAPRDVFVYFINGAKERAPAAARALLQRLA